MWYGAMDELYNQLAIEVHPRYEEWIFGSKKCSSLCFTSPCHHLGRGEAFSASRVCGTSPPLDRREAVAFYESFSLNTIPRTSLPSWREADYQKNRHAFTLSVVQNRWVL